MSKIPEKLNESGVFSLKQIIRTINEIRDFMLSLRICKSATVNRRITSNGTTLDVDVGTSESSSVQRMVISSVQQTYFGCRAVGDSTLGPEIWVVKQGNAVGDSASPNQKTSHLTNPTVDLVQSLTPPYSVGTFVYVALGVVDGTGVMRSFTVTDGDGNTTTQTEEIKNLEISPCREWVDPLQSVCVSINGVRFRMWVRGSPSAV